MQRILGPNEGSHELDRLGLCGERFEGDTCQCEKETINMADICERCNENPVVCIVQGETIIINRRLFRYGQRVCEACAKQALPFPGLTVTWLGSGKPVDSNP